MQSLPKNQFLFLWRKDTGENVGKANRFASLVTIFNPSDCLYHARAEIRFTVQQFAGSGFLLSRRYFSHV
jgi:hypothetical protein